MSLIATRLTDAWAGLAHQYQARRDLANRAIPAVGLALLLDTILSARPVYPAEWHVFLLVVVALLAFSSLLAGLVGALALAAWPLWTLSPYLAALALAVVVSFHLAILKRFNWALMVAAAPALAYNVVFALPPLLAGTFLGPAGGFWVGALAALWLKIAGGLAGLPTDLLTLHVEPVSLAQVAANFAGLKSLETLQRLVAPFSVSSPALLLDILQILGCGLAGAAVGWVRRMSWAENRPWANLALAVFSGSLILWAAVFALPYWVGVWPPGVWKFDVYTLLGVFLCPIIALGLYALRYLLTRVRKRPATAVTSSVPVPAPRPGAPDPGPPARRRPPDDPAGRDVIKLELD